MGYVLLALALVFNACANILLKMGSAQFALVSETGLVRAVLTNYALVGGCVLFALNVVLYALALSRIPLSVGYPIMTAGALVIITAVSVLYLRESLTMVQMAGLLLLLSGIVLVTYK
jgi:multidrug transporter EmrE-like cation transporter